MLLRKVICELFTDDILKSIWNGKNGTMTGKAYGLLSNLLIVVILITLILPFGLTAEPAEAA